MKVLDRSWKNCLRMWKWITENLPEGFSESSDEDKEIIVNSLKKQWLEENRFTTYINNSCFFCDYDRKHDNACTTSCPGCLVDPEFHCDKTAYSYRHRPSDFYRKVLVLNAKRKLE